ncbi:hypothetical protein [Quisquiliibacterium transsilvanicum]|uniref:Uncharacterized protein n=1 Tax=Quisquiliibacterium transsilvanicum TaxID=1549638 RepID=A0A7W8HH43_9BURK|nr:hypothetical protein [Quisquiliibacterium transsilvanicum]MBB5271356.1 hypothetical protein [Quisquiliibacterium transsilvanicum]
MEYSLDSATAFLAASKQAVRRLEWVRRPSEREAQWYEAVSPVAVNGVIQEATTLRIQWRPPTGSRLEMYNAGLLFLGKRIYAVDYDPDKTHKNKCGIGRPYFGKKIGPGTHVHTPSQDGTGYAEPMDDFGALERLFHYFVTSARIDVPGGLAKTPPLQLQLLP